MVWRSKPADSSSCRPVMESILLVGISMPVIQTFGGCHALEFSRILGAAGGRQQPFDGRTVAVRHRLEARVGAEGADFAADVNHGFVQGIAESILGIAANDDTPGLRHECRETTDAAADHDVPAL